MLRHIQSYNENLRATHGQVHSSDIGRAGFSSSLTLYLVPVDVDVPVPVRPDVLVEEAQGVEQLVDGAVAPAGVRRREAHQGGAGAGAGAARVVVADGGGAPVARVCHRPHQELIGNTHTHTHTPKKKKRKRHLKDVSSTSLYPTNKGV